MSNKESCILVSLDTFLGCYVNIPKEGIIHALLAVDDGILDNYYLGSYLRHLDDYFCYRGDIHTETDDRGLLPKDRQSFFEKKLSAWLSFWSLDRNTLMGQHELAIQHNKKVFKEMIKD